MHASKWKKKPPEALKKNKNSFINIRDKFAMSKY